MIGIIRYLRGYVKIRVWGYSPERFMNLCSNRGIVLWGLAGDGDAYTMYLCLSDFFAIRDIVRKTKTKVAVLEKSGLPFFMRDAKRRKMFFAGIFFCAAFLLFMSRFLWAIEFRGNRMVTDDELYDFLKQQGVDYGVKVNTIDLEALEAALREEFSQVTWTSAKLDGCKVIVQIRENDLSIGEESEQIEAEARDGAELVATKSGVVADILTRSGVPQVKKGDAVEAGMLLVSGLIPIMNDDGTVREWQRTVADADILIECEEPLSFTQPLAYQYKNYTGREKTYHFFTLGSRQYRFPFGTCDYIRYDEIVEQKRLCLFGQIDLPVFTGTLLCREYVPVDALYDEGSAAALLNARLEKIISALEEKGVQIIQKDVKIIKSTNALVMKGTLTVLEEAVASGPITEEAEETKETAD